MIKSVYLLKTPLLLKQLFKLMRRKQSALPSSRPQCALLGLLIMTGSNTSIAATVTDLLLSEIMANPAQVGDSAGEWFELYNPGSTSISLNGITLSDNGSNSHQVNSSDELLIAPGHYFVFARSGDSNSNGGFLADYVYGNGFSLTNSSDQIILTDTDGFQLSFAYSNDFVSSGKSRELTSAIMHSDNYALATTAYGLGDLGTPGTGSYKLSSTVVPLPGALWLMLSGLIGLVSYSRSGSGSDQRSHS